MNQFKQLEEKAQFKPLTEGVSYSSAYLAHKCPWAWHRRYIDKIKAPPSVDMLRGKLADIMWNTNDGDAEAIGRPLGLSAEDCALVAQRVERYRSHIDYGLDRLQVPVWREIPGTSIAYDDIGEGLAQHKHMMFYGFMDRVVGKMDWEDHHVRLGDKVTVVPMRSKFVPTLLVDHKFGAKFKPMSKAAKEVSPGVWRGTLKSMPGSWKRQGQGYVWAGESVYKVVLPCRFDIVNAEDERIQLVDYKPKRKTLDAYPDWLRAALDIIAQIKAGNFAPTIGPWCEWKTGECEYHDVCPEQIMLREMQEECTAIVEKHEEFDPGLDL